MVTPPRRSQVAAATIPPGLVTRAHLFCREHAVGNKHEHEAGEDKIEGFGPRRGERTRPPARSGCGPGKVGSALPRSLEGSEHHAGTTATRI
jgi:hypothetical protein